MKLQVAENVFSIQDVVSSLMEKHPINNMFCFLEALFPKQTGFTDIILCQTQKRI